jgi:deoxyribodipyrimidine photo-lyase
MITLNEVKDIVLRKHSLKNSYKLIQELAWRDFFQSVYLSKGQAIFSDLKYPQLNVISEDLPQAILEATTGITAIDTAIKKLYSAGYIHNHERMWIASIVCNVASTSWLTGAKWMYHYLLDGDVASNMLSWQWVAGSFSSKKYYANQENINKYSGSKQFGTFLDASYEGLNEINVPQILQNRSKLSLKTKLSIPEKYQYGSKNKANLTIITKNTINNKLSSEDSDCILHLDIDEQKLFPISQARLDFLVSVIEMELPTCKILLASTEEMSRISGKYTEVTQPKQDRMFPLLTNYYPSFFKFWDKAAAWI